MLHIFLRNKFLIFLFPIFLWGFEDLYSLNGNDFEIVSTPNTYKLVIKKQQFINYKGINGFKFFIPDFTKEFSLKILRYNSIGYINGVLSMDKNFSRILFNISKSDLRYYLTDYKTNNQRELDYLLRGYSIPYSKVTSVSIEAYNIPTYISFQLNKEFYFKINRIPNNKLEYILYSVYIILDRKLVDKYTKRYFPNSDNLIITFLNNINTINPLKRKYIKYNKVNKKQTKIKSKKYKKIVKKVPKYRLKLHRFLYMVDYGYIYFHKNKQIDTKLLEKSIDKIVNKLQKVNEKLYKDVNTNFLLHPKDIYVWFSERMNDIISNVYDLSLKVKVKENKCNFNPKQIDDTCFKNPLYFHNYIYEQIKSFKLPNEKIIMAHSDFKTFNDIGKFYFENGELEKSEIYLKKAYILADNKVIPAHNLSVLYATHSDLYDIKKAIKYLKESNLEIDYYNLGVLYYIGLGVKESDKKAREYFKKALSISNAKDNYETMKKFKIGLK